MYQSVLSTIESSTGIKPPISLRKLATIAGTKSLREALDGLYKFGLYRIYMYDIWCKNRNEKVGEFDDGDEVFAYYVVCVWDEDNSHVIVSNTDTYKKLFSGSSAKDPGGWSWIWGGMESFGPLNPDNTLFFFQAMEEDCSDKKPTRDALVKVLGPVLAKLVSCGATRQQIAEKMLDQMNLSISATYKAGSQLVSNSVVDGLQKIANGVDEVARQIAESMITDSIKNELKDQIKGCIRSVLDIGTDLDIDDFLNKLKAKIKNAFYDLIMKILGFKYAAEEISNFVSSYIYTELNDFKVEKNITDVTDGLYDTLAEYICDEIFGKIIGELLSVLMSFTPLAPTAIIGNVLDAIVGVVELLSNPDEKLGNPQILDFPEHYFPASINSKVQHLLTFSGEGSYNLNFYIEGRFPDLTP